MSCHDILGKRVKVMNCSHLTEGVVVGESKNAVYILKGDRIAVVPKGPCYFLDLDSLRLIRGTYLIGYRDVRLLGRRCLSLSDKRKRK